MRAMTIKIHFTQEVSWHFRLFIDFIPFTVTLVPEVFFLREREKSREAKRILGTAYTFIYSVPVLLSLGSVT